MKVRWGPYSSGLLATGAIALLCGAIMTPARGVADSLEVARQNDGRWLLVSVMLLLASFCLNLGMPACYSLVRRSVPRFGLLAVLVFTAGTITLGGYSVLLVFYRALVVTDSLRGPIDDITDDVGIAAFLGLFMVTFYGGELLLALALLRVPEVRRWVPAALAAHVLLLFVSPVLPPDVANYTTILATAGLCGVAMAANEAWYQRTPGLRDPG